MEKNSLHLFFLASSPLLLSCLSPLLPDLTLVLLPAFPHRAICTITQPQRARSPAPLPADPSPAQAPSFQPRFPSSEILTTFCFCHLLPCCIRLQTHFLVILSAIMHPKPQLLSNGLYPISELLLLPLYSRSSFQIQTLT